MGRRALSFHGLMAQISGDLSVKTKMVSKAGCSSRLPSLLRAQELSVPLNRKQRTQEAHRLGADLLGSWGQSKEQRALLTGRVTWSNTGLTNRPCHLEQYRANRPCHLGRIQGCLDLQTWDQETQGAELNLERDVKNNRKTFYTCIGQKRQVKASVPPL